jgi:protein gp37
VGETEISWTHRPGTVGRSWNPVQGCRRISPGCEHCYAERMASRFAESGWSHGLINLRTRRWSGNARVATHKITEPLHWRKPATVFVNSMSDLFYEGFSFEEIAAVFGVMAATPQHTYQVLTKRAARMREWFEWIASMHFPVPGKPFDTGNHARQMIQREAMRATREIAGDGFPVITDWSWPLPNVWIGVSVEDQQRADERIPELVRTPAAVRFLSCEPLLEQVTLPIVHVFGNAPRPPGIDWVICGCESGPGARPCEVAWLRVLRNQCKGADVPFFLKQARHRAECIPAPDDADPSTVTTLTESGQRWIDIVCAGDGSDTKGDGVIEAPYLDGHQHLAFPVVT